MSNNNLILVIDDNKDFLEIFSTKLEAAGFNVITALGAKKGLAYAKGKKPDLILLDVEMPEMTGVEVLAKLKEDKETRNIRISFLTNYGEPKEEKAWMDEKFARETGAIDYIKKSEDLDEVVKEVKTLLENNNEN